MPQPPGDSWLESDESSEREDAAGFYALLLVRDASQQQLIEKKLQQMGYTTTALQSVGQALDELRTAPYRLIVCGTDAEYSSFHGYLTQSLPQQRRRLLYYVLIGPGVHTCYDLQALALSANLVVNVRELSYLDVILRKGLQEYEKLFGPFLEILGETR